MTFLDNSPHTPTGHKPQTEICPPAASPRPETGRELRPEFDQNLCAEMFPSIAELRANPPVEICVPSVDVAEDDMCEPSDLRRDARMLVAVLWQVIGLRGAAGMAAQVKAVLRQLFRREKQAMTVWAKQCLRRSAEWQARVLEDLGGEAGLSRWQARLRKSYETPPEDDYAWLDDDPADWPVPEDAAPRPVRPYKIRPRFKTDRDGLFRWASIKLGRRVYIERPSVSGDWHDTTQDSAGSTFFKERSVRSPFPGPWPIEVLPGDLIDPPEQEDEIDISLDPDLLDPITLWEALQAEHRIWWGQAEAAVQKIKQTRAAALLVPP